MALFNQIKGLRPHRSLFNLSYDNKFNCDYGQLIPVMCLETIPGDTFKIGSECIVRLQPTLAPILQQIDFRVEYFFVPCRLLWEYFEEFITTGKNGLQIGDDGKYEIEHPLPLWDDYWKSGVAPAKYTLWDYFGLPLVATNSAKDPNKDMVPISFPRTAYNLIFNNYYKDENVDEDVSLDNNFVLNRRWKKDYFTSALPFQQRGQAPGFQFDISSAHAVFKGDVLLRESSTPSEAGVTRPLGSSSSGSMVGVSPAYTSSGGKSEGSGINTYIGVNQIPSSAGYGLFTNISGSRPLGYVPKSGVADKALFKKVVKDSSNDTVYNGVYPYGTYGLDDNEIEFNGAPTGFNIAELRESFQIQKWMERNARGGYRYIEQCLSHFGVSAKDSRLQRPEYLGMVKSSIVVSEIAQTSESGTTAQGTLAGRGLGASAGRLDKFFVPEHGYIMGIFSIVPKLSYCSQGINKTWLRRSVFDYYFPEFSHLSEQQVRKGELYYTGNASVDTAMFGYQGIYDEYRHSRGIVTADMRDTFDYWHLSRKFASQPVLNSDFLKIDGSSATAKRIFAVQDEPGFIVDFYNDIRAVRPMPKVAEPGFIDHF